MEKILHILSNLNPTTLHKALAETGYTLTQSLPGSCIDGVCLSQNTAASDLGGIVGYVSHLWIFGISIGGILALAMIVYGAIEWTVSAGNASKIDDARDRITQAVIGLVLLFGAFTILSFINPALTNFNAINTFLTLEGVPVSTSTNLTTATDTGAEGTPQSHPLNTCIDCFPFNNILPMKPETVAWCSNLEAPFNHKCYLNMTLQDKLEEVTQNLALRDANNNYMWHITEAYPPSSTHSSPCHNKLGTCADIAIKKDQPYSNCNNVALLVQEIRDKGLKVLNEYPGCTGGTTTEHSTGGHLHVYLP